MNKVLFVGLDVDDKNFHGAGLCEATGETFDFKCKPTKASLLTRLRKLENKGFDLKVCYEASYIGFSLHRDLAKEGIDCEVVASSLIPHLPSDRVKTDRLDSEKLSIYYAKGLLTSVSVPDEENEQSRDFIRSRSFLVDQRSSLKRHILSICRRYGFDYKNDSGGKNYWTKVHLSWLDTKCKSLGAAAQKNMEHLISHYDEVSERISDYNDEIEQLSTQDRYKDKSDALCCFRGVNTLSAMTLITEIGDVKRFSHPKRLTSYAGLDIREYSSGGKEKKFGITKMGNRRIRTTVVEACQMAGRPRLVSRRLKEARRGQPKEVVAIADKCMNRLREKHQHLQRRNKPVNVAKVACSRELLSFAWEALMFVEKKNTDVRPIR